MYYTVKQVADILCVTVQAIHYRRKLKPKHHLYIKAEEMAKGVFLITEEELKRIQEN